MKIAIVDSPDEYENLSEEQKSILKHWIWQYLIKIKTVNKNSSSYGIKHLFEASPVGFYITNGMFKGAMLDSGFYTDDETAKNWSFNVSRKSIRELYQLVNHGWKNK